MNYLVLQILTATTTQKNHTFSEILTTAPGCQESVIFAKDGYTPLDKTEQEKADNTTNEVEDIQININLEDVVHNSAHLVGNFNVKSYCLSLIYINYFH